MPLLRFPHPDEQDDQYPAFRVLPVREKRRQGDLTAFGVLRVGQRLRRPGVLRAQQSRARRVAVLATLPCTSARQPGAGGEPSRDSDDVPRIDDARDALPVSSSENDGTLPGTRRKYGRSAKPLDEPDVHRPRGPSCGLVPARSGATIAHRAVQVACGTGTCRPLCSCSRPPRNDALAAGRPGCCQFERGQPVPE